jgi:hypothetical protein
MRLSAGGLRRNRYSSATAPVGEGKQAPFFCDPSNHLTDLFRRSGRCFDCRTKLNGQGRGFQKHYTKECK